MQDQNQGTPITTLDFGSGDAGGSGIKAPVGEYEATLVEVADMGEGQFEDQYGNRPHRVRFTFRIDKVSSIDEWPDGLDTREKKIEFRKALTGYSYYAYCNFSKGPRSDMYKWVSWMTGEPMKGQFDVGSILDVTYRLTLGWVTKQKPDGSTSTKIEPTGIRRLVVDDTDDDLF